MIYWYNNYCNNYTDTHTGKFLYIHIHAFLSRLYYAHTPAYLYTTRCTSPSHYINIIFLISFFTPFTPIVFSFYGYAFHLLYWEVSWCSWLSHHFYVVRVPGSNPGGTIFMLYILLPILPVYHDYPFLSLSSVGSYQVGYTRSHPNTEVKMLRACSVPLCSHRRERQVIYLFIFLILTNTIIDTNIQYDHIHTHDNTMLLLYTLYR